MNNPDRCIDKNPDRGVGMATRPMGDQSFETLHRRRNGQWYTQKQIGSSMGPKKPIHALDAVIWLHSEGLYGLLRHHFPDLFNCTTLWFGEEPNVVVKTLPKGLAGARRRPGEGGAAEDTENIF